MFFFYFYTLYNKSNLFCQGIIALKWQNSPKWGKKRKRKKISHNHFFKFPWSSIDCSCCQLKCCPTGFHFPPPLWHSENKNWCTSIIKHSYHGQQELDFITKTISTCKF